MKRRNFLTSLIGAAAGAVGLHKLCKASEPAKAVARFDGPIMLGGDFIYGVDCGNSDNDCVAIGMWDGEKWIAVREIRRMTPVYHEVRT